MLKDGQPLFALDCKECINEAKNENKKRFWKCKTCGTTKVRSFSYDTFIIYPECDIYGSVKACGKCGVPLFFKQNHIDAKIISRFICFNCEKGD